MGRSLRIATGGSERNRISDSIRMWLAEQARVEVADMRLKRIASMIYAMGRTFDDLSATYWATEEFLRTNNPTVLGSRQDLMLLEDLRDAAQFTLHYDYANGIDTEYVCDINRHLTRTAAIEPGVLRTTQNIYVHTTDGDYLPGVPSANEILNVLQQAAQNADSLSAAIRVFAQIAKMQPFGDGNKRTALLAANGLLLMKQTGQTLIVPTVDPDRATFNQKLANWYLHDDPSFMPWFTEYASEHQNINEFGQDIEATK